MSVHTSADVWKMEVLLRKLFWADLVRSYPNAQIRDTDQQTVGVGELFEPCSSNGKIVNESNLNDKVRQYYNLLTIVFSDTLAWNLRYFSLLKRFHGENNSSWDLNDHTFALVGHLFPVHSMMLGSLSFVSSMYRANDEGNSNGGRLPPLDLQLQEDLRKLRSVWWCPMDDMFGSLDQISVGVHNFLRYNRHGRLI